MKRVIWATVVIAALGLAGCASKTGYQEALSADTALKGNSKNYAATTERTFAATKITLVRRGFTIESADAASGLIKATRNLQDKDDPDVSYNIVTTIDITPTFSARDATVVTASANQQTVLHRQWHTWWHLLWLIPLFPTGTEYQTVVTKEGNITEPGFYNDLFAAIDADLNGTPDTEPAKQADSPPRQ